MRAILVLTAALSLILAAQGCASCDPDESVSIKMSAQAGLNTYDGEPHKMDVYIYKVSDPSAFQATPINRLKGNDKQVPGGLQIDRKNMSPGMTINHNIGPMLNEIYTHIGVVTAYRQAVGAQVAVAEIPSDCGLSLTLGSNGIVQFKGR